MIYSAWPWTFCSPHSHTYVTVWFWQNIREAWHTRSIQQSERLQKSDTYYDHVLLKTSAVCSRSSMSNQVKLRSKTQMFATDISHYIACDSSGRRNAGTQVNNWTVCVSVLSVDFKAWASRRDAFTTAAGNKNSLHHDISHYKTIWRLVQEPTLKHVPDILSWTVTFSYISLRSV